MIVKLANTVIAPVGDDGHSGIRINGRALLDEPDFIRAESISVFNRKNQRTVITFRTHKGFDDQADAEVFMLDEFPALLALSGVLTLTARSDKKQVERYLAQAAVAAISSTEVGVSMYFDWEIHGGKILTEKP